MDTKPGDQSITPPSGSAGLSGHPPRPWLHALFAREWYRDAVREAQTAHDAHARRREILFAVCCAESYLLEWVGVEVLKRNEVRLQQYFPPLQRRRPGEIEKWLEWLGLDVLNRCFRPRQHRRRGVLQKWKEVPTELKRDGLISETPVLSGQSWQDFRKLVEYRDGLVHARASRPHSQSQTPDANPFPTIEALQALPAGWAVGIVTEQIRALNHAAGTSVPDWLLQEESR